MTSYCLLRLINQVFLNRLKSRVEQFLSLFFFSRIEKQDQPEYIASSN